MGFGKQLKETLDYIEMSVATLSKKTNIPASTLYSIIDRDSDTVGIDKVKKIEKALDAVPGSEIYYMLYGIESEDVDVSTRQQDLSRLTSDELNGLINYRFKELNAKGQVKVIEYAEDIGSIHEYMSPERQKQHVFSLEFLFGDSPDKDTE